jgi:hypothetical protein
MHQRCNVPLSLQLHMLSTVAKREPDGDGFSPQHVTLLVGGEPGASSAAQLTLVHCMAVCVMPPGIRLMISVTC